MEGSAGLAVDESEEAMKVLRIVAEGLTTSFRYPHFMQGVQPSYPMPPPATIYGHICSALGDWVDPAGVQFAYCFTHQNQQPQRDIEHTIVLSAATGKLPGTQVPKVLEGNVNPFERELLFFPRLTLYINRPEWLPVFRSPRYAVILGRSQDLFTYVDVRVVELEQSDHAYFEHTLLPYRMALEVMRGVTVLMPRFLDYERRRTPQFSRYVALTERVRLPNDNAYQFSAAPPASFWIDPTTPEDRGARRGLAFLNFDGSGDG